MLGNLGYQVTSAINGKQALKHYEKSWQEFDLVLLDLIMPELDGKETLFAMKKINPKVKVIIMSGYSRNSSVKSIIEDGALAFIPKPFSQAELSKTVALALHSNVK